MYMFWEFSFITMLQYLPFTKGTSVTTEVTCCKRLLLITLLFVGYNIHGQPQLLGHEDWREMLDGCNSSEDAVPQVSHLDEFNGNVRRNLLYKNSFCLSAINFLCLFFNEIRQLAAYHMFDVNLRCI